MPNNFYRPFVAAVAFVLSLNCFNAAWAGGGAVKVLGTKVFLNPPAGFAQADRFTGFVKKDQEATIVVTEIPGSYEQVVTGFTKKELAAKGMSLTATSAIKIGNRPATLIEFAQSAFSKKFKKVAVIFGDSQTTMLVTGTMPEGGGEPLLETLRSAVKTAHYDPRARIATIDEGMPFTVLDSKKFKKATRIQNTLLFTTSGRARAGKDNGPLFVAGQSVGQVAVENRLEYAKERLEQTPHLKNVTVNKQNHIKQAGLDGEEFLAEAVDTTDDVPTYVYHAMLFQKDGYFIFQGLCPLTDRAEYEPEYQKLVKNFQLR